MEEGKEREGVEGRKGRDMEGKVEEGAPPNKNL